MGSEKFSVKNVQTKMGKIENYFADFSSTLNKINGYIETNVNASLSSSVYGDLGSKLLNIWNHNASTFQDFHDNFDTWSQVVAIIAANNSKFAVEAAATYRDNAGTLDGVKEAREFVSKNNGLDNIAKASGYGLLSSWAKDVINNAYRAKTEEIKKNNLYGGNTISYTDAEGTKTQIFYDKDGNLVGKKITDSKGKETFYDASGKKVDKLPTASEYEEYLAKLAEPASIEDDPKYYKNYMSDLKYGSFTRETLTIDGEKIVCYVYKPDYGTDVVGLPVMMYMTGANKEGYGESIVTYGGLGGALNDKTVTPSGIVVIPYVSNASQYESESFRNKLSKVPSMIAEKYNGDTNKLSVGGTSYGAIVSYQLVTEHPGNYAAVVTAAGAANVTDAFKDVAVVNFTGENDEAGKRTGKTYVAKQSEAVNSAGGKSQVIRIPQQWAHTNVGTQAFGKKYDIDGDGQEEYVFEWAFDQSIEKKQS